MKNIYIRQPKPHTLYKIHSKINNGSKCKTQNYKNFRRKYKRKFMWPCGR